MRHSIAAAAAALSAVFVMAAEAAAQQPGPTCGPSAALMEGLDEYNEKMMAVGSVQNVDGLFLNQLQQAFRVKPEAVYLTIHGDKDAGGWTAVITTERNVSCVVMTGDQLEVQSDYSRAPGLPVSLHKWQTELQKLEEQLTWSKEGGQGLQLKGNAPMGEFRVYANTATGKFTAILHNPETGQVMPLASGDSFPSLEMVAETLRRKEEQKIATPAPTAPAAPAPEVLPQ